MKKFILLSAVSVALALAAGKAMASSSDILTLTMSGTVETVKTNYLVKTNEVQTTQIMSFNNATVYLAISNAVANITNNDPAAAIAATNLPAKGIIVYDPEISDGFVQGVFFVTTKGSTNFFYPLSGVDTKGHYYSYVELDTTTNANSSSALGFDLGPTNGVPDDFNAVSSFNSTTTKSSSTAVFYIHDNPYAYDAADVWAFKDSPIGLFGHYLANLSSPNPTVNNFQFSLQMQGVLAITSNNNNSGSATFAGTGNALLGESQGVITSGKLSIK